MGYAALRKQYDPSGALNSVPDEAFLAYVADHDVAGASPPGSTGRTPASTGPEAPAFTPAVASATGPAPGYENPLGNAIGAVAEQAKGMASDVGALGRVALRSTMPGGARPEDLRPAGAALAGLGVGALGGGIAGRILPEAAGAAEPFLARLLRGAGRGVIAGAPAGATDAAIRTGDVRQAVPGAVVGGGLGALMGGAHGAMTGDDTGAVKFNMAPPKTPAEQLAEHAHSFNSPDLSVEVQPQGPDKLHVVSIKASQRGSGHAVRAMRSVTKLADQLGVTMTGEARPLAGGQVETLDLPTLYKHFGAQEGPEGAGHMVRPPAAKPEMNFAKAFPEEFALVKAGKLEPGEAIHKALGQGIIIDPAVHEQMTAQLAKEAGVPVTQPDVIPSGRAESALGRMHDLSTTGVTPRGGGSPLADLRRAGMPEKPSFLAGKGPMNRLVAELAPIKSRLSAYGKPGQTIREILHKTVNQGEQAGGQTIRAFKEAGGMKLTPDENSQLQAALEGFRGITRESLSPKLQAAYDVADAHRNTMPLIAHQANVQVGMGENAHTFEPEGLPNYMRHKMLSPKELKGKGPLQDATARHLVENMGFKDEAAARAAMHGKADFIESGGREGGEQLRSALVESGVAKNDSEAEGMLLRMLKQPARKIQSSLEMSRKTKEPFYDPRPSVVLPEHFAETGKAMAEIVNMGQRLEKVAAEIKKIPDREDRETVRRLVRVVVGTERSPSVGGGLRQLNVLKFTPFTTMKNATQGPTNIPLTSDIDALVKGYMKAFTKYGERRSEVSGAVGEGARENIAQAVGKPKGLLSRYLEWIGFTPVERFWNRRPAALVGEEQATKYAARLLKNPGDKFAASELKRVGIDPQHLLKYGLSESQINTAALEHSHRSQFRLSALDVPAFANEHDLGRNIFQFKGFDYESARMVYQETVGRMRTGNPSDYRRGIRNLAILATVYPAFGEVVQNTMSAVTGVKRPSWKDKPLQRYGEDLLTSGAPATLGSLIQAAHYGSGDRGGSLAKWMMGPTGASIAQGGQLLLDVGGRVGRKNKQTGQPLDAMTPSQKRDAMRMVFQGPGAIAGRFMFPSHESTGKSHKKGKSGKGKP